MQFQYTILIISLFDLPASNNKFHISLKFKRKSVQLFSRNQISINGPSFTDNTRTVIFRQPIHFVCVLDSSKVWSKSLDQLLHFYFFYDSCFQILSSQQKCLNFSRCSHVLNQSTNLYYRALPLGQDRRQTDVRHRRPQNEYICKKP